MNNIAIDNYKETMYRMLRLNIPTLTDSELREAIEYSINENYTNNKCTLYNNYKKIEAPLDLEALTNFIMSKGPIMTPSGVLFAAHGTVKNPLYDMIEVFATTRDKFKKKMFQYPKGSELFKR